MGEGGKCGRHRGIVSEKESKHNLRQRAWWCQTGRNYGQSLSFDCVSLVLIQQLSGDKTVSYCEAAAFKLKCCCNFALSSKAQILKWMQAGAVQSLRQAFKYRIPFLTWHSTCVGNRHNMQKYNKCSKFDLIQMVWGRDYLTVAMNCSPCVRTLHGATHVAFSAQSDGILFQLQVKGHVKFQYSYNLLG